MNKNNCCIDGWVSDRLLEDNCIVGWAINPIDPKEHISVTVSIGEYEFNVVCNSPRKKPKKYKNYLDHGFRIYLSADQINNLKLNSKIVLKEQKSKQIICQTKIKESYSYIHTKFSLIELKDKVELIKNSHFFNESRYREKYSIPSYVDCAVHYLVEGWKLLFDPSYDFSTIGYFILNIDVFKAQVNPLLHYELQCKKNKLRSVMSVNEYEGDINKLINEKKPEVNIIANSKYFDRKFYNDLLSESDTNLEYPIQYLALHYLYVGWNNHLDPSKQFSSDFYLNMSLDVKRAKVNPLLHYERNGISNGRQISQSILEIEKELNKCNHTIPNNYIPRTNKSFSVAFVIVDVDQEGTNYNVSIQSILSQKNCNKSLFFITDRSSLPIFKTDNITIVNNYAELQCSLSRCNCDYVAFVSSGDVYTSSMSIAQNIECFKEENNLAVISYVNTDNSDESYVHHYRSIMHNYLLSKSNDCLTNSNIHNYSVLSNIVVKLNLIQDLNFDKCDIKFDLAYWIYSHLEHLSVKIFVNKFESVCCLEIPPLSDHNIKNLDNNDFMKSKLCELFDKKDELHQYQLCNDIKKFGDNKVFFSIILPSYNRAFCIKKCLDAVLNQSYQNFEIIIVDDGSSDDTLGVIYKNYSEYLYNRKIIYFYQENQGVSKARNKALSIARGDWICYVDSDNIVSRDFLKTFAYAIKKYKNAKMFYGKLLSLYSRLSVGRSFDRSELLKKNYIDMGTLCHSRELYNKLGGFDENLTKCVDWDLVLRYSKKFKPIFINNYVLFYNDGESFARISNTEKPSFNKAIIQSKNEFLKYPYSYTLSQKLLYKSSKRPVLSIKNPTPINEKIFWGDYWLGMDLEDSLKANRFIVRTDYREFFRNNLSDNDNIEFVIRGLYFYAPSQDKLSVLYIISHPDLVTSDEIRLYDIILCASNSFANKLKDEHPNKCIYYVPQFTNPTAFTRSFDKQYSYDLFFCGNTRHCYRDSVKFAVNNNIDISIFGRGWEEYVPKKFIKGQTIDNRLLHKYYSSSKIVLNDHHSDMKKLGFVSNRIYDVTSCGGFLISDYMPEIYEIYRDTIPMYKNEHEYVKLVKHYLDDTNEKERLDMAEAARNITISNFTVDIVAKRISDIITDDINGSDSH